MTTFEKFFGDKFSKFRLGQLLFITAITFGLFAGDIIRIVLGVFALFCLSRENFKFMPWTKEQKITGVLLALFCAWMIIIPIIFGENPLDVRLRDAVRPIELTLWIGVTFLFAKDEFYFNNFKNFSIIAFVAYAILAIVFVFKNHFSFANVFVYCWPYPIEHSFSLGAMTMALSAWIILGIVTNKTFGCIFSTIALLFATAISICTRYSVFWITLPTVFIVALILLLATDRKKFLKLVVSLLLIAFVMGCSLYFLEIKKPEFRAALMVEVNQLFAAKNLDAKKFTNNRWGIWIDAINAIKEKPLTGYGDDVFKRHSSLLESGEYPPHAHNTFLEAAFQAGIPCVVFLAGFLLMLFVSSVKTLWKAKKFLDIPFLCIVFLAAYITVGLVEQMYLDFRCILLSYWPSFAALVALQNIDSGIMTNTDKK